jgi:hypothetical protein
VPVQSFLYHQQHSKDLPATREVDFVVSVGVTMMYFEPILHTDEVK